MSAGERGSLSLCVCAGKRAFLSLCESGRTSLSLSLCVSAGERASLSLCVRGRVSEGLSLCVCERASGFISVTGVSNAMVAGFCPQTRVMSGGSEGNALFTRSFPKARRAGP